MKKAILLTAFTIFSVAAINTVSAQYYHDDNRRQDGYQQQYRGYGDYRDNRFEREEHREFHERRDMENDRRRIAALQYAMQEDRNCGNWDAYRYHEAQLRDLYFDIRRDHERMEHQHEWRERRDGWRY